MSIERQAGTPPPSLWLTDFYSGYVRNQGPFSGPLSLGFYLAIIRPFFYAFALHQKKWSDTRGRWVLYSLIVLSTFSRAARWMFTISSFLIFLITHKKYTRIIIIGSILALLGLGAYVALSNGKNIFVRTRSDKGHIEFFFQGLALVKQHWLRGLGAASVWPGSHHIAHNEVFNPENQYMQIWLEYWLFGVVSWLLSYISIARLSIRERRRHYISKETLICPIRIATIGIGVGILVLGVAGMVLHPFVDSSSMYPFMMLSGLVFGRYYSSQSCITNDNNTKDNKLESKNSKNAQKSYENYTSEAILQKKNHSDPLPQSKPHLLSWQNYQKLGYIWIIIISLLFVVQTTLVFGQDLISSFILSSVRDITFVAGLVISIWRYRAQLWHYLRHYRIIIVPLTLLIIINIYHFIISDHQFSTLAGIKYDLAHSVILVGGLRIGYLIAYYRGGNRLLQSIKRLVKRSLILIGSGIVRQVLKNIVPNFFIERLGYTNPNDFVPYTNPPIYYRTGAGGLQRLSGLFTGPNTLWFFLIVMTSVLYYQAKNYLNKTTLWIWMIVYYLITLATMSRGAIIGITIQLIILILREPLLTGTTTIRPLLHQWQRKKIGILTAILSIVWISLLWINQWKNGSNTERSHSQQEISNLIKQTSLLGYGPGFVWPARHYTSDYLNDQKNNFALVENIYLQTLINQWWLGLILWAIMGLGIMIIHYQIYRYVVRESSVSNWVLEDQQSTIIDNQNWWNNILGKDSKNSTYELLIICQYRGLGMLGLLSIGLFLHIFIDSMVNYLILIPYGILLAYSYTTIKQSLTSNHAW